MAVFVEKVGLEPEEKPWMRRGRRLEAAIAEEYAEETGRPVHELDPYQIVRHPDLAWLGCTRDRMTAGCERTPAPAPGAAPLELKAVSGMKAKEWKEEPPVHFLVQAQIQIACTAAEWASLAALVGGMALAWKDVPRHEHFLATALPRLEEFHLRVQRRDPPEADGLPATTAALKALYADDDGETVALDHDALQLAESWDVAKARLEAAEAEADEIENKLRLRLGSATFGALPDGSFLSLKTTKNKGYTRIVEPFTYRALRRFWPRLRRR